MSLRVCRYTHYQMSPKSTTKNARTPNISIQPHIYKNVHTYVSWVYVYVDIHTHICHQKQQRKTPAHQINVRRKSQVILFAGEIHKTKTAISWCIRMSLVCICRRGFARDSGRQPTFSNHPRLNPCTSHFEGFFFLGWSKRGRIVPKSSREDAQIHRSLWGIHRSLLCIHRSL